MEEENKRLKQIRLEYDFGYENINLITKNDLVKIDKNRYLIEIADGKFVDIKQVYLDNLNSIPVQKVKDKIKDIKEKIEKLKAHKEDKRSVNYINAKYLLDKIEKRLLEDK